MILQQGSRCALRSLYTFCLQLLYDRYSIFDILSSLTGHNLVYFEYKLYLNN